MTENKSDEVLQEQKRINHVISEIGEKINKIKKNSQLISGDVGQLRKTFWEDVTVNFDEADDVLETFTSIKQQAELLGERERSYGQIHKQLNTLNKLKYSPYFGRIDFKENGEETEAIYIGIASFMDKEEQNFYIYDWRAPISSIYYDYSKGPAKYEIPEGAVEGELVLKRQFIIRNGKVISLFDTGVTIGDELLLEVLGNQASTMMKSIVATIQKEQNKIIRNDSKKILVVQGVAGSGKTSAALQRVAYLLYRHRKTLTADNIMLFSPNPLFNSYVSTVLPELGEENMQQSTFLEYLVNRVGKGLEVEDPFSQLEILLDAEQQEKASFRLKSIEYKSSLAFKEKIEEEIHRFSTNGIIFKTIAFGGKVFFSKEELARKFYEFDATSSIPNRMELLKEWIQKEMKKHAKQERKQVWVDEEMDLLDKEDYLKAYKLTQKKSNKKIGEFAQYEEEEKILRRFIVNRRFKGIYKFIKNLEFINYIAMYKGIFMEERPKELPIDAWETICVKTMEHLKHKKIWNEDATPFAYFKDRLEGKKSNTGIKQVFIDEAQDYSPFQMAYIKELYPYSRMTLLGDVNQAIYAHANNELKEEDHKEIERIVLTKSYRSTQEIVEFTKEIAANGDIIEPFNRHGEKPVIVEVEDLNLLPGVALNRICTLKKKKYQTIALICKTKKESEQVYQYLKKHIEVRLIEKGTISYEKGISVIPAYLAKGIEFDAVILYNSSIYNTELERELFYTACTRAMHELILLTKKNQLNMFIKGINPQTYMLQIEEVKIEK
ncbi:RNA polymerase recycling motor HelD [Niallia nealsonii]|uniref:DNA 3'-5' helicase n=1 Tax=Niallia nealsonii TaxID=115979 RepID=A0A2N0YYP5_9BACI|nr:RNA polymerase recycling motor HelD [Niallia nealsonii]PKG22386.1 helicase [Niallia nealsonii]